MKKQLLGASVCVVFAVASASIQAATVDVNLAGWQTVGEFGDPGNTELFLNLGAGALITGYDYLNLTYTTSGSSFLDEFVLSVNNSDASEWLDWQPSVVPAGGTFGPASGSWNGPTGVPGPIYGEGAPFAVADGVVWVTVNETFDDAGLDATVTAGTLRIFYTPAASVVPEPSTYALMGLGLLGLGAAARRRS